MELINIMEAKVYSQEGIEIVEISGRLEMEKALPLKQACLSHCRNKKSVFSLNKLNFVGSSGIKIFFQIFKELRELKVPFKIVGIKADFQRFSLLLDKAIFEVFPTVEMAIASLKNPEMQFEIYQDPSIYSLHPIMPQNNLESIENANLRETEIGEGIESDFAMETSDLTNSEWMGQLEEKETHSAIPTNGDIDSASSER